MSKIFERVKEELEAYDQDIPDRFKALLPEIQDRRKVESVAQLRCSLDGRVLPQHTDHDLVRFLQARKFNVGEAAVMYMQMLDIRRRFDMDSASDCFIKTHTPMQVFTEHYPFGLLGYDREGCPIAYDFPGRVDVKGFAESMSDEEFTKQLIWNLETLLKMMGKLSVERGQVVDRWTVIVDVRDLSLEHFSKLQLSRNMKMQHLLDTHYPERVHKILVVNMSLLFDLGYKAFKPFVPEQTKEKIVIVRNKQQLFQYVHPSQLPVSYGGTLVDSRGDPECGDWISYGSKVPRKFYKSETTPISRHPYDKSIQISVPAGKTREIEVDVRRGSFVQYNIWCDVNIRHAAYLVDATGCKLWITHKTQLGAGGEEQDSRKTVSGQTVIGKDESFFLVFENKSPLWKKSTANISITLVETLNVSLA